MPETCLPPPELTYLKLTNAREKIACGRTSPRGHPGAPLPTRCWHAHPKGQIHHHQLPRAAAAATATATAGYSVADHRTADARTTADVLRGGHQVRARMKGAGARPCRLKR